MRRGRGGKRFVDYFKKKKSPADDQSTQPSSSTNETQEKKEDEALGGDYYEACENHVNDLLMFLPVVLVKMILGYWEPKTKLEGKFFKKWDLPKKNGNNPFGLCSDDDFLYIADPTPKQIYTYTFDGEYVNVWDSKKFVFPQKEVAGSFAPFVQEWDPRGIEIQDEMIYIVHKRMFTALDRKKNEIIYQWDLPDVDDKKCGLFIRIDQIRSTPEKRVFFTLEFSHRLYQRQIDGIEMETYGLTTASPEKGKFHYPNGVTTDNQYLYVCDYGNFRIQVLDKENGSYVRHFGHYGLQDNGAFYAPTGILLFEDSLYVSDWYRIQVFDKQGKWLQNIGQVIGKLGTEDGEFNIPKYFVIKKRKFYCTDWGNHRIQVFK